MKNDLRTELLAMAEEEQGVQIQLVAGGSLASGCHPRMQEIHDRNAVRLTEIIADHGWPGRSLVVEDGANAAWLVLQHAIAHPTLQRRGLELLRRAAGAGKVPLAQVAYLEDRVCLLEGRPQVYGTQYEWDENGELNPYLVEDAAGVDKRRRSVGLGPLAENTCRIRESTIRSGESPPRDWARRQEKFLEWCQRVGWRNEGNP